uniref:type I protein arginine methyltransferase n=1 Tax=Saccoglossus kowalevskii TaxID=10224 RepID=A0ABM0LV45_SACKO|nr:PREDICTED: histone-arginine methyltransferase CARMER-like [Saccoglossus kowalevskii]
MDYIYHNLSFTSSGKMFPSQGDIHIAPFCDEALYMEQFTKANFWYQQSFHGIDLSSLRNAALQECFRQPIVDTFDIRICLARSVKHTIDFRTTHETDLHKIEIPLSYNILTSGTVHGLAFWFDVSFIGSVSTIYLSTAPTEPLTHWYQVRCLLQTPIFVKVGQTLSGKVILTCNKRQSYDIEIEAALQGSGTVSTNKLDLKNPFFRYTGTTSAAPPGFNTASPTENYWNQLTGDTTASNGIVDSNGLHNTAVGGGVVQSNLVPLANTDPISHSIVMSGGTSQLHGSRNSIAQQRTLPVPSSVGIAMTSTNVTQSNLVGGFSPYNFNQFIGGNQLPSNMMNTSHAAGF